MKRNQVKWGAVLSYILIIINAIYGFVITPYILSSIGDAEYGVYKTISSLSSSLLVLDLGLGGTVMRYTAKYRSENRDDKIGSFVSMAFAEGAIIIAVLAIICSVIYIFIPSVYAKGLTPAEVDLAEILFLILAINIGLHIIENLMNGIISGHNKFIFANGLKLLRILWRMVLIFVLLKFIKSAVVLALIDFILTLIVIIVEYIFIRRSLNVKIKLSFKNWNMKVFTESFKYTILLFLTSIAAQINNNLDNVVIGAILGSGAVAVYSIGLLIFGMFEHLSTAISGIMLPTVTNVLKQEDSSNKIQSLIIQVGRIQFMLLGAALIGFSVIGDDFIKLWLGDGYNEVYIITLILMIPSLLELCVNVCLSVLRAKNMLGFRTGVLFSVTIMNAIVTVVGVNLWGYFAAAVGTALSFIIGSVIIMNMYYYKKLSFNMIKIYLGIFKRIWPCLLISGAALILSSKFIYGSWIAFVINVLIFGIVYIFTLIVYGMNREEKKAIPVINKFFK